MHIFSGKPLLAVLLLALVSCCCGRRAPYADWAHSHMVWVWDGRSQKASEALLAGYLQHDIPVGAIEIDQGWATGYNTFEFDTRGYPDAKAMVEGFHAKGVRVLLWATSMVEANTSQHAYATAKGYLLNGGETVKWWSGRGSFLDYSNQEAVLWWHSLMDQVLVGLKVDGFKCDGTDPFAWLLIDPCGKTKCPYWDYGHDYYSDFYDYSREKNPEALLWARPVDAQLNSIYLSYSPRRTCVSGWVGDDDNDWGGLQSALMSMAHSAWRNYVNFGSDIGGFRSQPEPRRSAQLFTRWAQLATFTPLMENGGGGVHAPWEFPAPVLSVYRRLVYIHHELGPFFVSKASRCFFDAARYPRLMEPLATPVYNATVAPPTLPRWDFVMADDIYVHPIVQKPGDDQVVIDFPPHSNWTNVFQPGSLFGGSGWLFDVSSLHMFPAFFRVGSMIPLNITSGKGLRLGAPSVGVSLLIVYQEDVASSDSITVYSFYREEQTFSYSWNTTHWELKGIGAHQVIKLRAS